METWIAVLVIFGLFFLLMRRGGAGMGCCGGGHSQGRPAEHGEEKSKENVQK